MDFLQWSIPEGANPKAFGWYHLLWVAIFIGIIISFYFLRNKSDKTKRLIVLSLGLYMLLWEVVKQIILITRTAGYDWHHAPFQPCSIAMYVIILWGILKPCKVRNYVGGFLISFCFFFGMTVVIMPAFVFAEYQECLLLWQSPQHHILLSAISVYLVISDSVKLTQRNLLRGIIAYLVIFVGFLIFNAWINPILPNEAYINGFYSGPYKIWSVPIVSDLVPIENYTAYLPAILICNIFGAILAFAVLIECRRFANFIKEKRNRKKETI